MSRNSFAFKSLAFKSLLQRVHFTGQQSLVKARSPLGHFQAIQSQSAPLGWAPQSVDQHEPSPLRVSPLGRQAAIALPELFTSNQARLASSRVTDKFDVPSTRSALPESPTDPVQPVQAKLETTERDRPSDHPTTPNIQTQVEATDAPEHTVRSPLQRTAEVSTHPSPDSSPSPIPAPQIALKSEPQRSPKPTFDRSTVNQNTDSPQVETVQHRPEKVLSPQRSDEAESHPPLIQPKNGSSVTTPERSETATVQARLETSSNRAIAPSESSAIATPEAPASLQQSTVPSTQREDAEPTARADARSPLQADALTSAPSAIQLQADTLTSASPTIQLQADTLTSASPTARLSANTEAMDQDRESHSPEQSAVTPHSPSVTNSTVQARLDSRPETSQATNPPFNTETTLQHSDQTLAIAPQSSELAQPKSDISTASTVLSDANSVSTAATRSPVPSLISPISSHHTALLLKPLGFAKTLVQPTDSTTSRLNVKSSNESQPDSVTSSSVDTAQRKEGFNSSRLIPQNHPENINVDIQASENHSVVSPQSDFNRSDTQALPSLQRQNARTDPAIALTSSRKDQRSNLSELLDFYQSDNSQSNSIHLEDSFDDLSFELNEFGEKPTIKSASSPSSNSKTTRSDPQSESLKSLSGDRPDSSKTLEQQLEALTYPIYGLIRQQWQIEQERHHHCNSSYPNWISDTRLSRLERSPKKNSHAALLEPIDLSSPLHRKLQLLAQQVYQLVQWQWAIDRERN